MITLDAFNYWVALGSVFLQLGTVYLFIEYFFLKEKYLSPYVGRFALEIVFLAAIASETLTLVYSEVFGFVPCALCWIQRGLLFSLMIICAVAWWKRLGKKNTAVRDTSIADYGIGLSVVAGVIALYQHYVQMGGSEFVTCPTSGGDCAQRLVFEFGYVTIPLMSLAVFAFFIVVFLIYRRKYADAVDRESCFS